MNDLVKHVDFQDINMIACQTDEKKICVGLKNICEGLGIDYSSQLKRIHRDEVLSQGVVKMTIPLNNVEQQVNMLDIDYLPFFLIGIKSNKCKEQVRPHLLQFKLKAKDVLAAAFLQRSRSAEQNFLGLMNEYLDVCEKNGLSQNESTIYVCTAMQTNQDISELLLNRAQKKQELQILKQKGIIREKVIAVSKKMPYCGITSIQNVYHDLSDALRTTEGIDMRTIRKKEKAQHAKDIAMKKRPACQVESYPDLILKFDMFDSANSILDEFLNE